LRYSGTVAVFFAAINVSKVVPYAALGLIDLRNAMTSLVLLPFAPAGVALGLWAMKRVDSDSFYKLAYAGMALTGCKLLYDGLK
jgi:uncharacterized membrane protein YfcA